MLTFSDAARLVGYARVSIQDQDLAFQIDALLKYGVAKDLIFNDTIDLVIEGVCWFAEHGVRLLRGK